MHMRQERQ
jgi:hypothetical protein